MVLIEREKFEIEKFHTDTLLSRTQAVTRNCSNFNPALPVTNDILANHGGIEPPSGLGAV